MGDKFNKILAEEKEVFKLSRSQVDYLLDVLVKDHAEQFNEVPGILIGHAQDIGLIATVKDFSDLFYIQAFADGMVNTEGKNLKTLFVVRKKENEEEIFSFMLESTLVNISAAGFDTTHDLYEVEKVEEA